MVDLAIVSQTSGITDDGFTGRGGISDKVVCGEQASVGSQNTALLRLALMQSKLLRPSYCLIVSTKSNIDGFDC